ncbi:FAD-dependent oxidoreductase [Sciscionella marina]|uniref:FAD-dependent oxidoreductase n=1 Tax=Sciscionella marina TaxID=508770 RepID=UPI000372D8E9|nr:FAD-dependent oxidoreductase [Sciscionella marina]
MRAEIAVLGAGVCGLTAAIALQDKGFRVTVLSAEEPERTTSAVAGATWFPYKVDPPERVNHWARVSRAVFEELRTEPESGVLLRECHQLWRDPVTREPWWADAVGTLGRLPRTELPPGFVDSYVFDQPVIDMRRYLPYLRERFGAVQRIRVNSLAEASEHGEVLVNCSGLAAGRLAGDMGMYPIRGQVVRVRNPGIERVLADFDNPEGEAYIIPQPDSCILGGTTDSAEWSLAGGAAEADRIVARCAGLDPRIAEAERLESRIGLRPARAGGVRLESKRLANSRLCVHNYGHGGAGVTLSWGCAEEIAEVLQS